MSYKEHYIPRTPELAAGFAAFMKEKGVNIARLTEHAGVSYESVRLVLDPNFHTRRRSRVSKPLFLKMITSMTDNLEEVRRQCEKAAIPIFRLPGEQIMTLV